MHTEINNSDIYVLKATYYYIMLYNNIQGEDRKKWPPMKIGFLDYNCVKRAEKRREIHKQDCTITKHDRRTNTFEPQV